MSERKSAPRRGQRSGMAISTAPLIAMATACGTTTSATPTTVPTAAAPPSASPVASLSGSPTAAPTTDPTAEWVTYTSAANHLTFKHPADAHPLECGWVFIDPTNPTACPQGDGFCCIFLRSSDNGQTGGFSLISDHRDLYPDGVATTTVTVNGVTGTRLAGNQTIGQGGGPQVEYDFTTKGRTYNFFAYLGEADSMDPSVPAATVFDQMVQTVTFTS